MFIPTIANVVGNSLSRVEGEELHDPAPRHRPRLVRILDGRNVFRSVPSGLYPEAEVAAGIRKTEPMQQWYLWESMGQIWAEAKCIGHWIWALFA